MGYWLLVTSLVKWSWIEFFSVFKLVQSDRNTKLIVANYYM